MSDEVHPFFSSFGSRPAVSLSLSKKRKLENRPGHEETPSSSTATSSSSISTKRPALTELDEDNDSLMFDDNEDDLQFLLQVAETIPEADGKGKEPLRPTPPRHTQSASSALDHDMAESVEGYEGEIKSDSAVPVELPTDASAKVESDPVALMNSLSVTDAPEKEEEKPKIRLNAPVPTVKKTSKRIGEDVFTEASVKEWQLPRIKAWEGRHINPEGYYFRFVVPGEGQQNGGWSKAEHARFMERYNEWMSRNWKIGASWGLFSRGIPHRVGYQCMNYYRKLVGDGKIKDDSYEIVGGKLKQAHKERAPAGDIPTTEIGPEWQTEEVKEIERNVDQWLKQYHSRSGLAAERRPVVKAMPRPKPSAPRQSSISSSMAKTRPPNPISFLVDDGNDDEDAFMESVEPERANLRQTQLLDWEKDYRQRLDRYRQFMMPYLDRVSHYLYWEAKQAWRRGLTTTEKLLMMRPTKSASLQIKPKARSDPILDRFKQTDLSRYFAGVKAVKTRTETPDEFISFTRIPNELFSGVHRIKPVLMMTHTPESRVHYCEVDTMHDSVSILDALLQPEEGASPLEGVLVDPPWDFYIKDGRNDGRCDWNIKDMMQLMDKVLKHMSAGLIFMWTHKLLQADVLHMMDALGCKYVENLVWYKKSVNNAPLDQPSPYFSSAKEILLMFKKGDGFMLRHQRTADVIIDFERPTVQWIDHEYTEPKPPGVYTMIETLLPHAGFDETKGRGRLLELWAKRDTPRREGWISIHQRKPRVDMCDTQQREKQ